MQHASHLPRAVHLIWPTYGTWLPGDERGWNQRGDPVRRPPNRGLAAWSAAQLRWPPLYLDRAQREVVAAAFADACARNGWVLHEQAVQTAHVHVVVEADVDASAVRGVLKRAATRALRRRWPSLEGRELWAGSGWTRTLGAFVDGDRAVDYARDDHHRPRR